MNSRRTLRLLTSGPGNCCSAIVLTGANHNHIGALNSNGVCSTCLRTIRKRLASTAAAAVEQPTVPEATEPRLAYDIKAGLLLSRPPLITRDLHPFEKAFYLYQKRLNERLSLPFTRYFYFNKRDPAAIEFQSKIKERKTAARDIGLYDAWGPEAWNDEVVVGALESEPDHQADAILKYAEPPKDPNASESLVETAPLPRPMPRITEADKAGDEKSLNRQLQKTLYLVVKEADDLWRFPSAVLIGREHLRSVGAPSIFIVALQCR
jgi:large subunit ribosomal protein L46